MTDIILRLVAQGVQQVQNAFNQVEQGANGLASANQNASQSTADLSQSLNNASDAAGDASADLNNAADAAGDVGDQSNNASQSANGLMDALERTRNIGLGVAAAGAAGLAITGSMIEAANEGNGLEARLESILETQGRLADLDGINDQIGDVTNKGHFDDDDSIREAAIHLASFSVETQHLGDLLPRVARQVRTGFGDMKSVADGMGKAYSNIDLGPLSRSGLVFTEMEKASLDAAKGISEAAGRAKWMEVVLAAVDRNTVTLEGSLTGAQQAANDLANQMDGAMTEIGTGAGLAKMHVDNVLASVLGVINTAPGLEQSAGYLGYFVSGGATVVGSLMAVGSQIGMTILGLQAMGITGVGSYSALTASAVAYGTAAWAAVAPLLPLILAIGAAALATTAAMYYLTGAQEAIDQADKDSQQADEADKKFYEQQKAKGRIKVSFAEWQKQMGRGDENSEDTDATPAPPDTSALKVSLESIKSQAIAPPAAPMAMAPAPALIAAPSLPPTTAPQIGAAVLPTAPTNSAAMSPGEANIQAAMAKAQAMFGARDAKAKALYDRMQKAGFENEGGFQTEADEDAAKRVLFGNQAPNAMGDVLGSINKKGGSRIPTDKRGQGDQGRGSGPQTIDVPLRVGEYAQDASGEYLVRFVAEPIRLPRQGLGSLRNKVGR